MGARFEKLKSSLRLIAIKCLKGNAFPWLQLPEDLPPPLRAGGRASPPQRPPSACLPPARRRFNGAIVCDRRSVFKRRISCGRLRPQWFFSENEGGLTTPLRKPQAFGWRGGVPPFRSLRSLQGGRSPSPTPRAGAFTPRLSARARAACATGMRLRLNAQGQKIF